MFGHIIVLYGSTYQYTYCTYKYCVCAHLVTVITGLVAFWAGETSLGSPPPPPPFLYSGHQGFQINVILDSGTTPGVSPTLDLVTSVSMLVCVPCKTLLCIKIGIYKTGGM